MDHAHHQQDWLQAHAHEPNPQPPLADPAIVLLWNHGASRLTLEPAALQSLVRTVVPGCVIVSTGHAASGPFAFGGVRLLDLIQHAMGAGAVWQTVDVISADGFGTRVTAEELHQAALRPILLADEIDGAPLTREQGLVRLIVPTETHDALRQVKWVARIEIDCQSTNQLINQLIG